MSVLSPQFYPHSLEELRTGSWPGVSPRAYEVFGTNDVNEIFKGSLKTTPPWSPAPRMKTHPGYDREAVKNMLSSGTPPELEEFDPRMLHATQPWITQSGTMYYMGPDYHRTGRTFADQDNVGNKFPVVYSDLRGRNLILSGHHRSTAALLTGTPLLARRVRGSI